MKKFTLISAFLIYSIVLSAQQVISFDDYSEKSEKSSDDQRVHTVMNSFDLKRISGFGGPTVSYSTVNGEFAIITGGGGGVLLNNFFFGGYGESVSNSFDFPEYSIRNLELNHGGFWLGYEISPEKIIHPVISARVGRGRIKSNSFSDNIFVIVPTVSAEINFTRFFKINVGAEYRQVLNVNHMPNMSDKNFSAAGVYMNFIFGWF